MILANGVNAKWFFVLQVEFWLASWKKEPDTLFGEFKGQLYLT